MSRKDVGVPQADADVEACRTATQLVNVGQHVDDLLVLLEAFRSVLYSLGKLVNARSLVWRKASLFVF